MTPIGRRLYEQFRDVVIIREQVRVTDVEWIDFLQHARHGRCSDQHLKMLRSLIITSPDCPVTDFNTAPWSDAILVTPRHSVRTQWNRLRAAVQKHWRTEARAIYLSRGGLHREADQCGFDFGATMGDCDETQCGHNIMEEREKWVGRSSRDGDRDEGDGDV